MENIIQILIVTGFIIIFAVVRQLAGSNKKGKERHRLPLPGDDEEWEEWGHDHSTLSAGMATQQLSKKQTKRKQTRSSDPPVPPPVREEPDDIQEFDIYSTEEVRRAIIWSEILNRKY